VVVGGSCLCWGASKTVARSVSWCPDFMGVVVRPGNHPMGEDCDRGDDAQVPRMGTVKIDPPGVFGGEWQG
jgi:hypothetical protein